MGTKCGHWLLKTNPTRYQLTTLRDLRKYSHLFFILQSLECVLILSSLARQSCDSCLHAYICWPPGTLWRTPETYFPSLLLFVPYLSAAEGLSWVSLPTPLFPFGSLCTMHIACPFSKSMVGLVLRPAQGKELVTITFLKDFMWPVNTAASTEHSVPP